MPGRPRVPLKLFAPKIKWLCGDLNDGINSGGRTAKFSGTINSMADSGQITSPGESNEAVILRCWSRFLWAKVGSHLRSISTLPCTAPVASFGARRSEEHTSELQSHVNLVCRLLL